MSNHQKGADTHEARQEHLKALIADAATHNITIQGGGTASPVTMILPDGSVRKVIFRYSTHTISTGFSFIFRSDDFDPNDEDRYYIFALVEPVKTRYMIIRHDEFKKVMKTPLESPTYQETGRYSFNFGRTDSSKLGKWEPFVRSWNDFVATDTWVLIPKAEWIKLISSMEQARSILNSYT